MQNNNQMVLRGLQAVALFFAILGMVQLSFSAFTGTMMLWDEVWELSSESYFSADIESLAPYALFTSGIAAVSVILTTLFLVGTFFRRVVISDKDLVLLQSIFTAVVFIVGVVMSMAFLNVPQLVSGINLMLQQLACFVVLLAIQIYDMVQSAAAKKVAQSAIVEKPQDDSEENQI